MPISKQVIEEECQQLVHHLDALMKDRRVIHEEFIQLSELQKSLAVQLRSDSLAGEGNLHAFQVEKTRIEDRLEELEVQLKYKNALVNELDSKASEYLLNVTTESNSLYDEEDASEQSDIHKDVIQKLVLEEMQENSIIEDVVVQGQDFEKSDTDAVYGVNEFYMSTAFYDNSEPSKDESSGISENDECNSLSQTCSIEYDNKNSTNSFLQSTDLQCDRPTKEQMLSLSSLLDELRTVKDDLGKCMTIRNQSSKAVEEQFSSTRQELSFLRESMDKMTDTMMWKDSVDNLYKSSENIEQMTATEYANSDAGENDEYECARLNENLSRTGSYSQHYELIHAEKSVEDETAISGMESFMLPGNRPHSVPSLISAKVAMLECQLKDSNSKLIKSNNKINLLLNDRNSKSNECEILQKKVHNVETKMIELQGIFDELAQIIASERYCLLKKLQENSAYTLILERKLECSQTNITNRAIIEMQGESNEHNILTTEVENEVKLEKGYISTDAEKLKADYNKEVEIDNFIFEIDETTLQAKVDKLQSEQSVLIEQCEQLKQEKSQISSVNKLEVVDLKTKISELQSDLQAKIERENLLNSDIVAAKHSIRDKEVEINEMDVKIVSLEKEMNIVASSFGDEIKRLQEENLELEKGKSNITETLHSVDENSQDLIKNHNKINMEEEEHINPNNTDNSTVEKLQHMVEDHISKNVNLTAEIKNKTEFYKEELNIKDATIQELQLTLTNNQKQSRKNYEMLEEDMTTLTTEANKEKDATTILIFQLKEKCLKLERDFHQKDQQYLCIIDEMERLRVFKDALVSDNHMVIGDMETIPAPPLSDTLAQDYAHENRKVFCSLQEKIYSIDNLIRSKSDQFDKSGDMKGESSQDVSELHISLSRFDSQLLEIKKLNDCLDIIKLAVEASVNEFTSLKKTVEVHKEEDKLEGCKSNTLEEIEVSGEMSENQVIVKARFNEEKKNLVNELELKLSVISDTFRGLNLEKIINQSFESLYAYFESNLNIKRIVKEKYKLELKNSQSKYANVDLNLNDMSVKLIKLEEENFILTQDKLKIIENYKNERLKTIAMENQMVSDMEALILDLESEKKELISSLVLAQEKMKLLSDRCETNQQQRLTSEEVEYLKTTVSGLELEKGNLTTLLKRTEAEFSQKYAELKEMHTEEIKILRKDMTEEIDILEQQKDQTGEELRREIAMLKNDCLIQLNNCEDECDMRFKEENTRFGRILVEKNDEYIKVLQEKQVEATGYEVRLTDLRCQLDVKLNIIEELETNMEEMIIVRDNLEKKILNR